jgi:hypothetical protein
MQRRESGEYEWVFSSEILAMEIAAGSEEHITTFEIKA